jgi:hypothetical protein
MAQEAGVALSASGVARAGMGIDAADLFNDGGLAVAIGNFSGEGLALFRRTGPIYVDAAHEAGLIPASLTRLTFGLAFLDADRDGRLDLFTYNGHVNPHVAARGTPVGYRQAPQLFRSEGRRFRDVTAGAGAGLRALQLGRGCAIGDYDDDGRPDLLLAENGGRAWLLRNATGDPHHWLGLRLRGRGGNTDAFGAEIRLAAGGVTQRRWVRSGTSYLSQHDPRALFGLGSTATVDRVEIVWPSGRRTHVDRPAVDRYHVLDEPP